MCLPAAGFRPHSPIISCPVFHFFIVGNPTDALSARQTKFIGVGVRDYRKMFLCCKILRRWPFTIQIHVTKTNKLRLTLFIFDRNGRIDVKMLFEIKQVNCPPIIGFAAGTLNFIPENKLEDFQAVFKRLNDPAYTLIRARLGIKYGDTLSVVCFVRGLQQ